MQGIDTLRRFMGWCPVAAAAQQKSATDPVPVPADSAAEAGPATARTLWFTRLTFAVLGISWLAALAALPFLPDLIPTHWNIYGEPDAFSGRFVGAFSLPILITIMAAILIVLPRLERIRASFDDSRDIYAMVIFATTSLLFGIEVTTLLSSAGMDLPVRMVFPMLLGFFFIVIGGLMPSVRRNRTIGFRLPWTIRSEKVWNETHRAGGPVFVIAGILIIMETPVAGNWATLVMLVIIGVAILYVTLLSYRLAKDEPVNGGA